jgi:hypothetical protein
MLSMRKLKKLKFKPLSQNTPLKIMKAIKFSAVSDHIRTIQFADDLVSNKIMNNAIILP